MAVVLLLAGCATPYGPRGASGGYEDQSFADDRHHVTVYGNGFTTEEQLQEHWQRRARELCKGKPFTGSPAVFYESRRSLVIAGYSIHQEQSRYPRIAGDVACVN